MRGCAMFALTWCAHPSKSFFGLGETISPVVALLNAGTSRASPSSLGSRGLIRAIGRDEKVQLDVIGKGGRVRQVLLPATVSKSLLHGPAFRIEDVDQHAVAPARLAIGLQASQPRAIARKLTSHKRRDPAEDSLSYFQVVHLPSLVRNCDATACQANVSNRRPFPTHIRIFLPDQKRGPMTRQLA